MAVEWSDSQSESLQKLLDRYPVASGQCGVLARAILPIARNLSGEARGLRITPKPGVGYFVVTKSGRSWPCHALVAVEEHGVDALTGLSGTLLQHYLATYWKYIEYLEMQHHSLQEPLCP